MGLVAAVALAMAACDSGGDDDSGSESGTGLASSGGTGGSGGSAGDPGGTGGTGGAGGGPVTSDQWPLIDDQDFVIPSNAVAGDTVGHAKHFPTIVLAEPSYAITSGNDEGLFAIEPSTGLITVSNASALSVATYDVVVAVQAQATDSAVMRIRVIDAGNAVFIDPTFAGTSDGTRANPYDSWADVTVTDGGAYLQKRGTTYAAASGLTLSSNAIYGAYGAGARPIVRTTSDGHGIQGYQVGGSTIRDLEFEAAGWDVTSLVYFNGAGSAPNVVDNCRLHGAMFGIRMTTGTGPHRGHQVLHTEVFDIGNDGIFVRGFEDLEFGYLRVHHVNQQWFENPDQGVSSGDGIQLNQQDGHGSGFVVHHSWIDRSDTGNKFALIASGADDTLVVRDGIIEHNLLNPPRETTQGGATVYLRYCENVTLRHNTFERGETNEAVLGGVWTHLPDTRLHGNVFRDLPVGIWCNNGTPERPCEILNNVFSGVASHIRNGAVLARNNIFDVDGGGQAFEAVTTIIQDHNLFTSGDGLPDSIVAAARFVDRDHGDFRLQADSPAIDAGVVVGLAKDRLDVPIPQGSAPDIGAYEYVP